MKSKFSFILIDDSQLDLFIHEKLLLRSDLVSSLLTFYHAGDALSYFVSAADTLSESIILLDLQMPEMNGFQFVEAFSKQNQLLQKKMRIFILSSTVNKTDIDRINSNPHIEGFFFKTAGCRLAE